MLTSCSEYRPRLIELARGTAGPAERRALMAHVELCADCARVLDEQAALTAALTEIVEEPLPEMAAIEARVLAEFDRARWSPRFRRALAVPMVAGLAAAALIGVVVLQHRPQVTPVEAPPIELSSAPAVVEVAPSAATAPHRANTAIQRVRRLTPQHPVVEEQPFLPIPYTVPLAPEERVTVVRMQVPVAALIASGFSVSTSDPGGVIDADVLVSQDGRARAIRLNVKEEK